MRWGLCALLWLAPAVASADEGKCRPTERQQRALDEATAELEKGEWETALGGTLDSLAEGNYPAGFLLLARSYDKGELILEAVDEARKAAEQAEEKGCGELAREARDYARRLDADVPRFVVDLRAFSGDGIRDVEVLVDGAPVPHDRLAEPLRHDPGKVQIDVRARSRDGETVKSRAEIAVVRGETMTVWPARVRRRPPPYPRPRPPSIPLDTTFDVSTYHDDNGVAVVSPSHSFTADDYDWKLVGRMVVDVVSAASTDVVSAASPRFRKVRYGGGLSYSFLRNHEDWFEVSGFVSAENDYLSRVAGARWHRRDIGALMDPYLSYRAAFDTRGRAGDDYATLHRFIHRHTIELGTALMLEPDTLAVVDGSAELVFGDTSSPYRHVPLFEPAAEVPALADPQAIAALRLPFAPLEQLPDRRYRFGGGVGLRHRFDGSTVRLYQHADFDTWGRKASTSDVRWLWDIENTRRPHPQVRIGPHARFHYHSAVGFWQHAYAAVLGPDGLSAPDLRTGDRDLGPLWTLTSGATVRVEASPNVAFGLDVAGMYTRFLDDLYFRDRWGLFTSTTLEIDLHRCRGCCD